MLLAALLFWAPLPFGSVTPAGTLGFRVAAFGLLAMAVTAWRRPRARSPILAIASLAGIAVLGLVQSCGWPAGLGAAVSPEHARLYREAAVAAPGAAVPSFVPLTLDPARSRSAALSWLAAAALLTAALAAGRRPRHRRWLLASLGAAALIQIIVGALALAQSSPHGLAVLLRAEGRLRGTLANPNHLSLLFEMTMAAVAAWGWWELNRASSPLGGRLLRFLAPLSIWLILLAGVVRTGSRVGLIAAAFGLATQAAAMMIAGRGRRIAAPLLAFLMMLGALTAFGSRLEMRRFENASIYEDNLRSRLLAASASLRLWSRFPVTGTGLGTFEEAFPAVAPPALTRVNWNRAHNNPVELLVTAGLVGLALGALALAAVLLPILRLIRWAAPDEDRAAGLAALGALGAAGFHELLDFGLVVPANHLALLVILGAAVAAESAGRRRLESEIGGQQRSARETGNLDEMESRRDVDQPAVRLARQQGGRADDVAVPAQLHGTARRGDRAGAQPQPAGGSAGQQLQPVPAGCG